MLRAPHRKAPPRRLPVAPHPTAFGFANAIGEALDPRNWPRREWLPALKKAGLEKQFHVHELRHFAATALDEQGTVGKLRTEIVGHANEEITNSTYIHVRRERVAAVAVDAGGNWSYSYTHNCVRSHTEDAINSEGDDYTVTVCDWYSANGTRWTLLDPLRSITGWDF